MTLFHSRPGRPAQRTPHPACVQLVTAASDHVAVEPHEEAHLVRERFQFSVENA